jgi:nucleotide-binding universal stress UspA family protein
MIQAALDGKAVSWRPRLTGPVLLADRGAADAAVARRAASDVAARLGAPVRLVTAWEVPAMVRVTPGTGDLDVPGLYEGAARAAQTQVRQELLGLGSVAGAGYVAEGPASAVVARTADLVGASLVVIGSRAGSGLGGHLLGLLPEALVRAVHGPVLVARGRSSDWPPRRIVIVDDESIPSSRAADEGATLARVLAIPADLVRVIHRRGGDVDDAPGGGSFSAMRVEARARAARLEAESGAEVSPWVTIGELTDVLLGLASDPRVLFAVGRRPHGRGLGRTVSALLHHAAGPVLIVPEEASSTAHT